MLCHQELIVQETWSFSYISIYLDLHFLGQQSVKTEDCGANSTRHSPTLICSSHMQFTLVSFVLKYLNFTIFSKYLLSIFMWSFCPVFWSWDINIFLHLSAFCARPPNSLLATNKASVFLFIMCMFLYNKFLALPFKIDMKTLDHNWMNGYGY